MPGLGFRADARYHQGPIVKDHHVSAHSAQTFTSSPPLYGKKVTDQLRRCKLVLSTHLSVSKICTSHGKKLRQHQARRPDGAMASRWKHPHARHAGLL